MDLNDLNREEFLRKLLRFDEKNDMDPMVYNLEPYAYLPTS